jgi:predicted MPP superfamily phosphohydrolase
VWLARELRPLGRAAPAFGVPGNHDYDHFYPWARPHLPEGGDRLGNALERAGIDLLRNERRTVDLRRGAGSLEIVGLDDFWSPNFDDERAFDGASDGATRLVLSHNPDSFRQLVRHRFDLMLAGHTHGGQVRIPLLGAPVVPVEDRRFIDGLVEAEDRVVYVNRGLGYNRRIRFGVRPEITLLTLRSV